MRASQHTSEVLTESGGPILVPMETGCDFTCDLR